MYKFERKVLLIAVAIVVFLILIGILVYLLVSEPGTKESPPLEEQTREDREEILKNLKDTSAGEQSELSAKEREEILKFLSVPQ